MKSLNKSLEDLSTIKNIMDRSTKFLSLSGLSGVFAGLAALAGSAYAMSVIPGFSFEKPLLPDISVTEKNILLVRMIITAMIVLVIAIGTAVILSFRKARRKGLQIWTPVSRRLLISMIVPLATGAFFILILLSREMYSLIVPSMLIFYGLSLVNAGKFTFSEVFYLGILEIVTGFAAAIFAGYSLYFWIFGFGILHIVYGLLMYRKYDR